MPDEKSLEYTITNTAKSGKYKITNTYVTDPAQSTLLIQTRFQSLDGGTYRLYLLANPSMAGGGGNDNAWWDGTNGALMASDTQTLFGSPLTVDSALKVSSGFTAHDNGFSGRPSDCYVDLSADKVLNSQFDNISGTGNVVQCARSPSARTRPSPSRSATGAAPPRRSPPRTRRWPRGSRASSRATARAGTRT
jgi:glucoamylase